MTDPIVTQEKERGCGYREPGGIYAVSPGASVQGTISVDCNVALLEQPIPIPPDFGNRRRYVYVDGQTILDGRPGTGAAGLYGRSAAAPLPWHLPPQIALANRYQWLLWGMPFDERTHVGVCADLNLDANGGTEPATIVRQRLNALTPLPNDFFHSAAHLNDVVQSLRATASNDCPLLPAISIAAQMLRTGASPPVSPAFLLTASWQLAHAVRWARDLPKSLLYPLQAMMIICGAVEDAMHLRNQFDRYLSPRRLVPDLLDWVGATHYPTDDSFIEEAHEMGISRRMPSLPQAAQPGISRVFLAHPKCTAAGGQPAIFGYYYISELHYIIARPDEPVPSDLLAAGVIPIVPELKVSQ